MKESIRVLKPGGMLYASIPNYDSIFEGHYYIFWLPNMSKKTAKFYVSKIFHRDPYLIDELNFTTPKMFNKYLNSKETYGKIYLNCFHNKKFGVLFSIYNYLDKDYPIKVTSNHYNKHLIKLLKVRILSSILRRFLWIPIALLKSLGLASAFDLYLYKR